MASDGKGTSETAKLRREFGWLLLIGGTVGLLHAIQARGTNSPSRSSSTASA